MALLQITSMLMLLCLLRSSVASSAFPSGLEVVQREREDLSVYETFLTLLKECLINPATAADTLRKQAFTQIINLETTVGGKNRRHVLPAVTDRALPVVQMHGMGDFAKNPSGMVPLAVEISRYLGGAYVLNVQIGESSVADILNGFIMNLDDQVDYFAKIVQSDSKLSRGFNAVGYSQGNLIIRGYVERYNDPPVLNFISMHGPLAGIGGFPGCSIDSALCRAFSELLGDFAYKTFVQNNLAQANYFRDPLKIPQYLVGDRFLADINNEVSPSATYKSNWSSLKSVCLVKATADTVVIPNDSEWLGFFEDGSFDRIWQFTETPWYLQDSFGLQSLHSSGRVSFNTTDGDHLDFDTDFLLDLVGTYFL